MWELFGSPAISSDASSENTAHAAGRLVEESPSSVAVVGSASQSMTPKRLWSSEEKNNTNGEQLGFLLSKAPTRNTYLHVYSLRKDLMRHYVFQFIVSKKKKE